MILVVDDHEDTRNALVMLLKLEGYDARGVVSGGEAMLYLAQFVPWLVILDYNMPDISGLDVLIAMKADPRLAAVPVVMFSAHSGGDVRELLLAHGAAGYVPKSTLDWVQLSKLIASFVGRAAKPEALPSANEPPEKEIC